MRRAAGVNRLMAGREGRVVRGIDQWADAHRSPVTPLQLSERLLEHHAATALTLSAATATIRRRPVRPAASAGCLPTAAAGAWRLHRLRGLARSRGFRGLAVRERAHRLLRRRRGRDGSALQLNRVRLRQRSAAWDCSSASRSRKAAEHLAVRQGNVGIDRRHQDGWAERERPARRAAGPAAAAGC